MVASAGALAGGIGGAAIAHGEGDEVVGLAGEGSGDGDGDGLDHAARAPARGGLVSP